MASTYELIVKAVDQTSAPMNKIDKALKGANTRTTKLNATLKKTNNGLKTFGKAGVKGLGSLTKGLGVAAAAATAAAGAFAFMAKQSINTLDSLGKTASKLGVTTEFLSKYQVVASRAGISTETFNMGLQRFLRRLGEAQQGSGELLKPLKQMGINMKDANGNFREGTDVFAEFMNKLAGTENSTQKLALAMKGFDSEGVAMVNIADMGADKIALIGRRAEEAGLVISGKLTTAAADANDALSDLFDFGKGFKLQFFGALSETIQELSEMLREKLLFKIEAAGGMKSFANDIAAAFLEGTSKFITATAKVIDQFTDAFNTFGNIFKQIVISISNIPGVGFDANFGDKASIKAKLELDKASAQASMDELQATFDDSMKRAMLTGDFTSVADMGTMQAMEGYMAAIAKADEELAKLEDGSVVFFEKVTGSSTAAQDAVSGFNDKLLKQAAGLRKVAADAAEYERTSKLITSDAGHFNAELEKQNKNLQTNTETVKAAIPPLNQFDQFMRDLTNSASSAATKIIHEQQAVAELDRLLAAGTINIDTYAQAMIMLGKGAGEAGDKIAKMAPHVSQFDQFMRDLVDSSNAAVTTQGFEIMALGELDAMLKAGKISLDAYAMAKESIRPTDFTKEAEELTFQQQLVESYKENHKELEEIEKALKNVSQLALDASVSEAFLTDTLKQQEEQLKKQLGLYQEKAITTSDIIQNGFEDMSNSIGSELATAIRTGESMFDALSNAFTRTLDNILQQILTSQINSLLADLFNVGPSAGMGGGGGGLGSLITGLFGTPTVGAPMGGFSFGGMRATGGPVANGNNYLVGERGPELFSPTTAGSITPFDEVNSGNKQVVFNINAVDTQTGVEFLIKNKPQIINMVSQGFNQRGRQGITS